MFRCLSPANSIYFNIKKHIIGQYDDVYSIFHQKVEVLRKGIQNNKNLHCLWLAIVTLITILKNDKCVYSKRHIFESNFNIYYNCDKSMNSISFFYLSKNSFEYLKGVFVHNQWILATCLGIIECHTIPNVPKIFKIVLIIHNPFIYAPNKWKNIWIFHLQYVLIVYFV